MRLLKGLWSEMSSYVFMFVPGLGFSDRGLLLDRLCLAWLGIDCISWLGWVYTLAMLFGE